MLESILVGGGFAFAAVIQPGPLQAFLLDSVACRGWRQTLPASFAPVISDIPIAILALFVLTRIPPGLTVGLRAVGGFFLLYLAYATYRQWRKAPGVEEESESSTPKTILQAVVVNILNPNPYIGWSLVLGPAVLVAWSQKPANAVVLVIAFYVTMVAGLAFTILLFGMTELFGPDRRRTLILVSAVILASLGVYQLIAAIAHASEMLYAGTA
jgi:threonine/homoserine/homoserine lactone efflux protein